MEAQEHSERRHLTPRERMERWRSIYYTVFSIIGIAIIVVAVGYLLGTISTAVATLAVVAFLVFILRRPVAFFERKGIPRSWGSILGFLIIAGIIALLVVVVAPLFGDQFTDFIGAIPGFVNQALDWITQKYNEFSYLFTDDTAATFVKDVTATVSTWVSNFAGDVATFALKLGTSLGTGIIMGIMAVVATFWILKDLPRMGKEVRLLVGPKHIGQFTDITGICACVADGYLIGMVINSITVGVIAGVAFAILGLPYAAVLGPIFCLFNVVPYLGPWTAGAIAAIVGLTVSPLHCIIALIITVCAEQFVDIIVYPRVMGTTVQMHPAMVMVGIILGAVVGGVPGMILIVPMLAIGKAVFVYFFEKNTGRRIVTPDGALFKGKIPSEDVDAIDPALDAALTATPATEPVSVDMKSLTHRMKKPIRRSTRAKGRKAKEALESLKAPDDEPLQRMDGKTDEQSALDSLSGDDLS